MKREVDLLERTGDGEKEGERRITQEERGNSIESKTPSALVPTK